MSEDSPVTSGLASFTPHDVKVPQEPRVEAAPAPLPQNPPIPDDVRAAALQAAYERKKQEAMAAEREQKKRDFMQKVAEARRPVVEVHVPQPIAPAILSQTQREMAEGARQNKIHEERLRAGPVPPRPDPQSTPVYRPADHVPNMNQGQNGLPQNVKAL